MLSVFSYHNLWHVIRSSLKQTVLSTPQELSRIRLLVYRNYAPFIYSVYMTLVIPILTVVTVPTAESPNVLVLARKLGAGVILHQIVMICNFFQVNPGCKETQTNYLP
jgi:hypothetical protein